jgi:hypothetical protein
MRPHIEVAHCIPCQPGFFALELVYDDEKPSAYRNAIVAWALESGSFAPYPITLEGLIVEDVAILRPDGAVDLPCNAFYDNLQEWLDQSHAKHIVTRTKATKGAGRPNANAPAHNLPASTSPSPAHLAIHAALDEARDVAAERLAKPQGAHTGKVSP